jgi:lysozyme family protein
MADFKIAYAETMKIEGGYASNPSDKGGETWKGISRHYHPNWPGWSIIDSFKNTTKFEENLKASQTLQRLVLEFYKEEFWDVMKLDQVENQFVANEMFDTGVNMDPHYAIEFLQKAIKVTSQIPIVVDGKMGPASVDAINHHPKPTQVLKLMNCQQGVRYMDIASYDPTQEIFMTSWLSRVVI